MENEWKKSFTVHVKSFVKEQFSRCFTNFNLNADLEYDRLFILVIYVVVMMRDYRECACNGGMI